jgi:hypothetical protein
MEDKSKMSALRNRLNVIIPVSVLLILPALAAAQQPLESFVLQGSGTGTANGGGVSAQGTSKTNLFGPTTFALTFTNGKDLGDVGGGKGSCSLENGTVQLTNSQGTISLLEVGMACNATNAQGLNTFQGTYQVTEGTGRFAGMTGTGGLTLGLSTIGPEGSALITISGILQSGS